METLEAIKIALPLFAEYKNSDWKALVQALENTDIPLSLTDRLLEFMPLAFGRVFMDEMGVEFKDYYIRYDANTKRQQQKKLNDSPIYKDCFEVASHIVSRNMAGEAFTAVAFRSAELLAVNGLLNKGSKLNNVVLTPPYLQWLEEET